MQTNGTTLERYLESKTHLFITKFKVVCAQCVFVNDINTGYFETLTSSVEFRSKFPIGRTMLVVILSLLLVLPLAIMITTTETEYTQFNLCDFYCKKKAGIDYPTLRANEITEEERRKLAAYFTFFNECILADVSTLHNNIPSPDV
ncbi:unnamed protein product [Dicrocoelium dendriticum]|nr:unnamed protein product [Dicrocoelium dendriticum]